MLLGAMLVGFVACEKEQEPIVNNNDGDKTEEEEKPFVDKSTVVNGHEAVDLGLSVLWATCNIGATSPERAGDYYAWGAVKTQTVYNWAEYAHGDTCKLTKYCFDVTEYSEKGKPVIISYFSGEKSDSISTLEQGDDVAYEKWRGSWRMPTAQEQQELRANCNWEWTTQGGVSGMKVTSRKNGNSIFLPAAGYFYKDELINNDVCGGYWSSSLADINPHYAERLHIGAGYPNGAGDYCLRSYGQTVRAVCPY